MTLILTQSEIRALLPMDACMDLMAQCLATLAHDEALNPLRSAMWLPDRSGLLGLMPGFLSEPAALGVKLVGVFPGNHGTSLDSHQGLVALFDEKTGVPTAILEASEITAIRTAAVSGVASRLLATEDASDLAILGSGVQAHSHLAAMLEARPISRGLLAPHRMGRMLWAPMLVMAVMAFMIAAILGIVRAALVADGDDADTVALLGQFIPAVMFIGFASVLSSIVFAIGRILGALRTGGGEIQEAAGVGVRTLNMPGTAKLMLLLMMMAMMGLLFAVIVHFPFESRLAATSGIAYRTARMPVSWSIWCAPDRPRWRRSRRRPGMPPGR